MYRVFLGCCKVMKELSLGGRIQEGHDLAVIFLLVHHYSSVAFVSRRIASSIAPRFFWASKNAMVSLELRLFSGYHKPSS